MPVRKGIGVWRGDLPSGDGTVSVESGVLGEQPYTFASRFEEGKGTNPDELLGAAHAGCFSMALANMLAQDGHRPTSIRTEAHVALSTEGGAHIEHIELRTEGEVPGIDEAVFREYAEKAKTGCPVSKALAATEIRLQVSFLGDGRR